MKIQPDHEKLSYSGRIDWSDPKEPVFVYPCTSVGMRFTGNELKVRVRNQGAYWDNYLGCILDGRQTAFALPGKGIASIKLEVKETENQEHEVLFFKRQDACHELAFLGVELAEGAELLDMPKKPERKIEVYGDSVSAGEVSEAVEFAGKEDPEHNGEYSNSWYSYAWMTARKLNAQIHDIAQGGIALLDKTGWFHAPDYIGMETAWDKIHYHPQLHGDMDWDFARYTPQVVIVALGQSLMGNRRQDGEAAINYFWVNFGRNIPLHRSSAAPLFCNMTKPGTAPSGRRCRSFQTLGLPSIFLNATGKGRRGI